MAAIVVVSLLLLSGCATTAEFIPTGGSKVDGVVEMSYMWTPSMLHKNPTIDWQQASQDASGLCSRWGYDQAEAFGGSTKECTDLGNYSLDCIEYRVTAKFQCFKD